MNKLKRNSFDLLKNNLEIIKLMKFIDESPLNDKFKIKIKTFLFSIEYDNYVFNDSLLMGNLQLNNLINIIEETVSIFNILSDDINKFEKELNYKITHFYNQIYLPTSPISDEIDKINKIRYEDEIYYLHDYVPDSTPKDFLYKFSQEKQDTSHQIWNNYKKNDDEAINRFTKELMCAISWISNNKLEEDIKRICLVSVPSSTHKRDVDSPIRKSINIIEKWYNCGKAEFEFGCSKEIINGGFLLYRFNDVETGHKVPAYQRPKYNDHLNSIKVVDENQLLNLDNIVFIIIDDISTTKGIIRACFDILKEEISEDKIIKLVIGKTVWWSR